MSWLMAGGLSVYLVMLAVDFRLAALVYFAVFQLIPITFSLDVGPSVPLLTFSRWLLLPLVTVFCARLVIGSARLEALPFRWPLFLFFTALLASNLFSIQANSAGWFRLFSFVTEELAVFLMAVSVVREQRDVEWLLTALMVGLIASVVFGGYELASGRNPIREMATGGREFLVYDYSFDVRFGFHRMQSFFRNPLDYGIYLAMLLPFALVYWRKSKGWPQHALGATALLGGLVALGLTWSRTPVYSLLVMVGVLLLLTRRLRLIGATLAIVSFALFMLVGVLKFPLLDYLILSATTPEQITDLGGSSLVSFWRITGSHLELFWQHPVFGSGVATLPPNPAGLSLDPYLVGFGEQGLTYLLVEAGLLGAGAFVWLFWRLARQLYRGWRAAGSNLGRELCLACLCTVVGYFVGLELAGVWHFSLVLVLVALAIRSVNVGESVDASELQTKPVGN